MLLKWMAQDNGSELGGVYMSIIKSFSLFYLSLTPLWLSVAFINGKSIYDKNINLYTEIISIYSIAIMMAISLIVVICSLRKSDTSGAQRYTLGSVKEEKLITAEYVLTYVLPLFAFDFTVWYEVTLFLLFFLVIAFLHVHHNRIGANVVLEILGYRYFECELINEDERTIQKNIISRKNLIPRKKQEIIAKPINNEYYLDITNYKVK